MHFCDSFLFKAKKDEFTHSDANRIKLTRKNSIFADDEEFTKKPT